VLFSRLLFLTSIINLRFEDPLCAIGRRDLDPLATGGGGMIFNPPMAFDPTRGGFPGLPRFVTKKIIDFQVSKETSRSFYATPT
jgi:hypothetical protein